MTKVPDARQLTTTPTGRHRLRRAAALLAFASVFVGVTPTLVGAQTAQPTPVGVTEVPVLAGTDTGSTVVAEPALEASSVTVPATITVSYSANFPAAARTAFSSAVAIWARRISSPVPIRIAATWTALSPGVLGAAGPSSAFVNVPNGRPGTIYPVALANRLAGYDLSTGPDITAKFSSSYPNWYFGTDGKAPATSYDFRTVVLHELGHGLGFVGAGNVVGTLGYNRIGGYPLAFDNFTLNGRTGILSYPNGSAELKSALTSRTVYFNGASAKAANGGSRVKLYAPATWKPGSSYSHLDEATFPRGTANSLMTPVLGQGEVITAPGAITRGILRDMGW